MGNLVFQATLGGQVNLVGPNTASTFNLNVPAVAGTLVTTGDTGTVTNTMCATSVYTAPGTIGSGTPNTGAFTTLTTTSTINSLTVGRGAGSVSTNTAVGASALAANTTGSSETAFGKAALKANTTGIENTAVGADCLQANTTGSSNSVLGLFSMYSNTTGGNNVAIGRSALENNTTASNNTAVGYQAGYSNTGTQGVFIGGQAGYSNTTANGSTHVGYLAGYSVTTGSYNALLGQGAGYYITTGAKNTVVGGYNGNQGGLDIRTSSNFIVLSDGDGNPRAYWDNNGMGVSKGGGNGSYAYQVINTGASTPYGLYIQYPSASPNNSLNEFLACNDSTTNRLTIRSNGGIANYQANNSNLSDRREKTNFAPAKSYLDVICAIPVQTFNYIDQNLEEDDGLTLGVVAQDVQAVAPELVMESNWAKEGDEPKMRLSIYQTDLQYALMKALQELKAEFDAYKEAHP